MNIQHEHPKDLHEALDWLIAGELEYEDYEGNWWQESCVTADDDLTRLRRKAGKPRPAWTMPVCPLPGRKWHRDDFTEADLPEGWRPLMESEMAEPGDEMFGRTQKWGEAFAHGLNPAIPNALQSTYKLRTRRPLPSADPYAELKAAHAAGKVIEVRPIIGEWLTEPLPTWSFPVERYRIKPDPQPWSSPDDVPGPVCWISGHDNDGPIAMMVVNIHTTGVTLAEGSAVYHYHWAIIKGRNYSTDRKTWKPCVKE